MHKNRWFTLGIVVLVFSMLSLGTGYWVYARQGHGMNENGQMMNQGQRGQMMGENRHRVMIMPMINGNMSKEEMNQFCSRMQKHHETMQTKTQKNTQKLNSLVQSMKQANGTDKIESMEDVLVELIKQHNKRGKMMMGSMRSMMGSMMGMHQMSSQQRQRMMHQMRDCQMTQGMMNSNQNRGTQMPSPDQEKRK